MTRPSFLELLDGPSQALVIESADSVSLSNGTLLSRSGAASDYVYLVQTGFLSASIDGREGTGIDVALIGREGLAGTWLALGIDATPFRLIARGPCTALRLSAALFKHFCAIRPDISTAAFEYNHAFTGMVADTCQAHARLSVEARLARWLLLADERLDDDALSITHDQLAVLLGVRRPGVTVSLHLLEGDRILKATRGLIRVLDREKLRHAARGRPVRTYAKALDRMNA